MSNTNENIFNPLTVEDQFFLLASHMPQGKFWLNCFNSDTNMGKLVKALGMEYYRLSILTGDIAYDYDIKQTSELILKWEDSCGIPQKCFSRNRSIEERRKNIEGLFSNFGGVQTNADYVRVGALYGYEIKVYAGIDTTNALIIDSTNTLSFSTLKEAKNTVVINLEGAVAGITQFPLPYPIPFYGMGVNFLDCIFRLLTPANVNVYLTTQFNS
jgi:uncharacterized protein YmfQ (DUF2313 family)